MKYIFFTIRTLIFLIIIVLSESVSFSQNTVTAARVDVSKYNINKEIISLDGDWEFYDAVLYTPKDFKSTNIKKPIYIKVPGLWNKILKRGAQGYGTYRLKILSVKKDEIFAININRIQSAYKLWINGKLYHESGKVSANKKTSVPKWTSDDILFKSNSNTIDLILQVSNYHHKKGGIENSILFGTTENISEHTWKNLSLNIFLLGALLIMATYHFAMFFFRRNDKSNLFFALTLLFSALFSLTVGEIFLMKLFPSFNWEILLKINHGSNYLRVIFFALFIYVSFTEFLNKYIIYGISIVAGLALLLVITTPAIIFTKALVLFLFLIGVTLIYVLIGQIKAIKNKKPGALFSFLGILVLLLTSLNDVLKELQIIQSIGLTTVGIFIFIIFHSYLISIQNSKAYSSIKKHTKNLLIQGKIKDALFSAKSYNLKAPLKSISKAVDADRALIFIYQNSEWLTTNEYLKTKDEVKEMRIKMFSEKENVYFSATSIKKAISSREPEYTLYSNNLKAKEIAYFEERKVKSVYSYPFIKDNSVLAVLYFENYSVKENFDIISSEILSSIMPQIIMYMDNFTSYNKLNFFNDALESKVLKITDDINERNKQLKILREETGKQNIQVNKAKENLEKQSNEISGGMHYAEKIQNAFLPKKNEIDSFFYENFIFYKPKSGLSGDFYWFKQISPTEGIYAIADSTGHGVSGALMSIIGHELLNDAILFNNIKSPKIILNNIQKEFTERIAKNHEVGGMDLAIIYYDSSKREVVYSGAQNPLYLFKNNHLIEYKATPVSIGNYIYTKAKKGKRYFANKRFKVSKGDFIYMFSDGFIDQTGYETGRKFMKKRFRDLLSSIHKETVEHQKETLEKTLKEWMGDTKQIDDILIAGIRF